MIRPTSGFFLALFVLIGLITFAILSIDRTSVRDMAIVGEFSEAQLASIKSRLDELEISTSEVEVARTALEELDWVQKVNVRKRWPSAIEIELHPHAVIAYWNDDGFISEHGDVLFTDLLVGGDLPHLYGPEGSEFEVMDQYQQLNQMLGTYGQELKLLSVSNRGSWVLETEADVEVLLGKEDLKARMQRFLTVSARLEERGQARFVDRMDARYINGVAVHFEEKGQVALAELNNSVGEQSL